MPIQIQNIQRVRGYIEATGAMGTDHSGTLGDFFDIPIIEGSVEMTLEEPTIDPMMLRQNRDDHNEEVLGVKRGKCKFSMNLTVPDARAGDGVTAASTTAIGQLLDVTMGGSNFGQGDTVNTSAATTVSIVVANGSRWKEGGCLGWADANGVLHLREIEEVSSNTVTLKLALPSAPLNSDPLYNCASFYLDNFNQWYTESLQLIVEGMGHSSPGYQECWVLMGGQIEEPPTLELTNGALPKITFSFTFADWEHGDEAAMTPAALANATYSNVNERLMVDSEFRVATVGTTTLTGTLIHVAEIAMEPQFKYIENTSPAGVNNIAAFVMDGSHPKIQGSFKCHFEDQTWFNARNNRTDKGVFLQIGSSETYGAILISAPTVQITDFQRIDMNGMMGQEVKWKGRLDSDTTEGTATALGISPFRIHIA